MTTHRTPDGSEQTLEERALEPRGVSRRTVLATSAWAVPALVTATAVPAAAASQGIFVAFAADLLQLHWSDRLAAVILITNTGSSAFTGDFSLVLTGFHPEDSNPETDFTTSFPPNVLAVDARNQPSEPLANDLFVPTFSDDGNTLTLTGASVTVPTEGLFLAIYLTRPAFNPRIRNYFIAGAIYINGVAQTPDTLVIETVDSLPPG